MRKTDGALWLQPSLLEEALRVAEAEGVALNQFINVAVAEKLSPLRTDDYFRERWRRQHSEGKADTEAGWPRQPSRADSGSRVRRS